MCGIAGCIDTSQRLSDTTLRDAALSMADALRHRGPDRRSVWIDVRNRVAFGHRRLAIVDLSPGGDQPMASASGRYTITFNGEIYNFLELREELDQSYAFKSRSDTEVILAAVEHWGLRHALTRFAGMFAFALWDNAERRLYLVRDRIGEKPLYYAETDAAFLFGSELKALRAYPGVAFEVDPRAVAAYLRYAYIPAPFSIYHRVRKLQPGHLLTIRASGRTLSITDDQYWSAPDPQFEAISKRGYDKTDALSQLHSLLSRIVRQQMIADVPLGAFLSGGVDSSTIVALMQAQSTRRIKTFTIGFSEPAYNEAAFAREIAAHLGTDHTEFCVTPQQARDVIPSLPLIFDEPFADSSQIPTFLVAQLARSYVTVSLSGDGGDEVFGGYNRYRIGARVYAGVHRVPRAGRRWLARRLERLSPSEWDALFLRLGAARGPFAAALPGEKLHKLAEALVAQSGNQVYRTLTSIWKDPLDVSGSAEELPTILSHDRAGWTKPVTFVHQMMYWDLLTYLPDDIMVKVDRATMAVSLESRAPYLDHRLIDFAARLPLAAKIRRGETKYLLRRLLYQYVPPALIDRPKMGFGLPIDGWLRGPLREWAEDLLHPRRMRDSMFHANAVRQKWAEHLSGRKNWHHQLWAVLMMQAWLQQYSATPAVDRVAAVHTA